MGHPEFPLHRFRVTPRFSLVHTRPPESSESPPDTSRVATTRSPRREFRDRVQVPCPDQSDGAASPVSNERFGRELRYFWIRHRSLVTIVASIFCCTVRYLN